MPENPVEEQPAANPAARAADEAMALAAQSHERVLKAAAEAEDAVSKAVEAMTTALAG